MQAMWLALLLGALTIEPSNPVEGTIVKVTTDSMAPCVILQADTYKPASMYRVNDTTLVFTGLRGEYLVQTKEAGRHVAKQVTIAPSGGPTPPPPDPVPPNPPDPPGPKPPTPTPDDVVDTYGFGKLAYTEALKVGEPKVANAIGKVWATGATKLFNNAFAGTPEEQIQAAIDYVRAESLKVSVREKWLPWASTMGAHFDAKAADGSLQPELLTYIRVMREVGEAMGKVK